MAVERLRVGALSLSWGLLVGIFFGALSFLLLLVARVGDGSGGIVLLVSLFGGLLAISYLGKLGWKLLLALVLIWVILLSYKIHKSFQVRTCKSNLFSLKNALKKYYLKHGDFPPRLTDLVPVYLPTIPDCPTAGKDTYSASYQRDPFPCISCSGRNHSSYGLFDYPAFTLIAEPDAKSKWPFRLSWASPSGPPVSAR